jgi:hypothetical protein
MIDSGFLKGFKENKYFYTIESCWDEERGFYIRPFIFKRIWTNSLSDYFLCGKLIDINSINDDKVWVFKKSFFGGFKRYDYHDMNNNYHLGEYLSWNKDELIKRYCGFLKSQILLLDNTYNGIIDWYERQIKSLTENEYE